MAASARYLFAWIFVGVLLLGTTFASEEEDDAVGKVLPPPDLEVREEVEEASTSLRDFNKCSMCAMDLLISSISEGCAVSLSY